MHGLLYRIDTLYDASLGPTHAPAHQYALEQEQEPAAAHVQGDTSFHAHGRARLRMAAACGWDSETCRALVKLLLVRLLSASSARMHVADPHLVQFSASSLHVSYIYFRHVQCISMRSVVPITSF
jgi:hypothetical protein